MPDGRANNIHAIKLGASKRNWYGNTKVEMESIMYVCKAGKWVLTSRVSKSSIFSKLSSYLNCEHFVIDLQHGEKKQLFYFLFLMPKGALFITNFFLFNFFLLIDMQAQCFIPTTGALKFLPPPLNFFILPTEFFMKNDQYITKNYSCIVQGFFD